MADKLIYLSNDDTQNYPFFRLQLVVKTIGHLTQWINQSKLLVRLIRKRYYKTLGTSVKKQLNVPSFPVINITTCWLYSTVWLWQSVWLSNIKYKVEGYLFVDIKLVTEPIRCKYIDKLAPMP